MSVVNHPLETSSTDSDERQCDSCPRNGATQYRYQSGVVCGTTRLCDSCAMVARARGLLR